MKTNRVSGAPSDPGATANTLKASNPAPVYLMLETPAPAPGGAKTIECASAYWWMKLRVTRKRTNTALNSQRSARLEHKGFSYGTPFA